MTRARGRRAADGIAKGVAGAPNLLPRAPVLPTICVFLRILPEMTIMTSMTTRSTKGAKRARHWGVAQAKARFSELLDRAIREGPQAVTRHGRHAVVVVSTEEWERKTHQKGSLAEFLGASPLRGSGLRVRRPKTKPRDIRL